MVEMKRLRHELLTGATLFGVSRMSGGPYRSWGGAARLRGFVSNPPLILVRSDDIVIGKKNVDFCYPIDAIPCEAVLSTAFSIT
jgi:hypothetical protein